MQETVQGWLLQCFGRHPCDERKEREYFAQLEVLYLQHLSSFGEWLWNLGALPCTNHNFLVSLLLKVSLKLVLRALDPTMRPMDCYHTLKGPAGALELELDPFTLRAHVALLEQMANNRTAIFKAFSKTATVRKFVFSTFRRKSRCVFVKHGSGHWGILNRNLLMPCIDTKTL